MARLSFRCEDSLIEAVDRARGAVPRERWLRDQVIAAIEPRNPDDAARDVLGVPRSTLPVMGGKKSYEADPKGGKAKR